MPGSILRHAALLASCLYALPASAATTAPNRVWVSVNGTDASGCSAITNPCRTFQYAENLIAPGGEIDVATPGGYGAVTITSALTINAELGPVTVQAASGNGITINAGPTDAIDLKGLVIDGVRTGANGIVLNSGGSLTVTNCTVRHFSGPRFSPTSGNGILVQPATGTVALTVVNSVLSDNVNDGLNINPTSNATVTGTVDRILATNNIEGILINVATTPAGAYINLTLSNNITNNNSNAGLYFQDNNNSDIYISLRNNTSSNNYYGMYSYMTANRAISYGGNVFTNDTVPVAGNSSTVPTGTTY